nr:C39 family peptidase [Clostridium saudiense]
MSWGKWGTNIKRGSESSKCDEVRIDVDTLSINEGYSGKAIELKIISYYDNKGFAADIREVAITYYKENNNDLKNKKYELINKLIETPCISQMKRDEKIAHKICSPTSLTMLLNRLGENLKVEDVAYSCFDYNYNEFGNWTYNVAYAGSLGYKAYVEYGGIDSLIREISNGNSIEVSVKYTNDINNKEYPYIENAPLTTSGHLIVVCGIEVSNNGKWVIVNDPAGKDDESVRLKYKFEDFMKAWQRSNYIMYVIYKQD